MGQVKRIILLIWAKAIFSTKLVTRGLETAEEMLKGWFVHYNFIRPHQSLNRKTPAEAAGINLNMNDGWGDLIELATRHKTTNE